MVPEEKLEEFRAKFKRVKAVEYNGHTMVFRQPTRIETKQYVKKLDDAQTRGDADEQFAQNLVIYFDGVEGNREARASFTAMLDDFPMAAACREIGNALSKLAGLVQDDELKSSGVASTPSGATPASSPAA